LCLRGELCAHDQPWQPEGLLVVVLVGVVVIVERHAISFGNSRIFVTFGRTAMTAIVTKSEVESPRTRLLQFSCFFEATMTTLLHGRAPNLEN